MDGIAGEQAFAEPVNIIVPGSIPGSTSQGYTRTDMDLSKVIMGYWNRFAASGEPNGGGGRQAWPFYGPKDRNLELGEQVKVNSGLFKQACDLAEKIHVGGKP